jgi:chemosensory pili system protein ChpA (sensor histidine kinase/response regulator)
MASVPATLLSWIKSEVDSALKLVRDSIAKFSAAPEDAAVLQVCPGQLHQVSGALRIVGLSGATRFCEAIEGTVSRLISTRPTSAGVQSIDRAVLALKDYIADLARGQANVPLRLYPAYRELGSLQGKPDAIPSWNCRRRSIQSRWSCPGKSFCPSCRINARAFSAGCWRCCATSRKA